MSGKYFVTVIFSIRNKFQEGAPDGSMSSECDQAQKPLAVVIHVGSIARSHAQRTFTLG